ncbi:MAG: AbrB/MazE/SpoVT family DNA-binding domain-containing protein [Symbiobacteriia bacterium]
MSLKELEGQILAQLTVSVEDGHISIPEELRQVLGWEPGDHLQFVLEGDQIVVYKLRLALVR